MRTLGFASLLTLLSLPLASRADETLTLDLPSSRAQTTTTSGVPAPTDGSASFLEYSRSRASRGLKAPSRSGPNRRAELRPTSSSSKEKVVGRLGVANGSTSIRAARGSHKRVLAKVPSGTYLALTQDGGDWYGVLMADHSTGWIAKHDVKLLNYEVVGQDPPERERYAGGSDTPLVNGGQRNVLQIAYSYLGVPYKWGGTAPNGMDCSAFVQRCFSSIGINLPRTAHEQYCCGTPISPDQLQAADRLYFASRDGRITHTGIYIGDGYFIHSSSSRGGVAVSRLNEPMYQRMFAGARR